MAAGEEPAHRGVMLAVGIILIWFGMVSLYVAFMSGKTPALTVGTSKDGKAQGPKDATELMGRLAANIQAAQGSSSGEGKGST